MLCRHAFCGSWWTPLWQLVDAFVAAGGRHCGSWWMPLWQLVDVIIAAGVCYCSS